MPMSPLITGGLALFSIASSPFVMAQSVSLPGQLIVATVAGDFKIVAQGADNSVRSVAPIVPQPGIPRSSARRVGSGVVFDHALLEHRIETENGQ
jgi:hypothetical protein